MWEIRYTARWLHAVLHTSLHVLLLLHVLTTEVLGGEMCTKSVPVQRVPTKKVSVLRRVPASCSNWEKAWSWITKKDCGTKYRLDMVEVPSQKVVTYRIQKVCCEGDIECQQAQDELAAKGLDVSDEKFLAIILGSTAAAVFVVVLVISISLCRKKKQCAMCEERRHIYTNTEDVEESSELQDQKAGGIRVDETETKVCESEYAEISDSGLPRYADIFKEEADSDPFTGATAPPISTYESRAEDRSLTNERRGKREEDRTLTNERRAKRETEGNHSNNVHRVVPDIVHQQEKDKTNQLPSPLIQGAARSSAEYYNCNQQRHKENCGSREDAVLSLSKDDPAVVTGPPSLSSSTSPNPTPQQHHQHPQNRRSRGGDSRREELGCDEISPACHGSELTCHRSDRDKGCTTCAQYDRLGGRGVRDLHEYQRLSSKSGSGTRGDIEMRSVGEEARRELQAFVHRDQGGNVLVNGHSHPPEHC